MAAVVVVGGGLAGLAAAARLARQRHDVTLLDAGTPGKRADSADDPASFTLPAVYRDLFRKTGRPLEPEVRLRPIDPARRYLFPDGRVLDLPTGSRGAMLDAFGRGLGPAAAHEWDAFIAWGGALWDGVRPRLVPDGEAPGSPAPARPQVPLREPATRLLLQWYASDAGADPGTAPAELAVLPYLEHAFGAWQVDGGLAALAAAAADRARRCGAVLRGGATVGQHRVRDGKITGVVLTDGSTLAAEVVVDAVGVPVGAAATGPTRRGGPTTVTVRLRTADEVDLPAETVLLPSGDQRGLVVVRRDGGIDAGTVCIRQVVHAMPAPGDEADLVQQVLAAVDRGGLGLSGEVIGISLRPVRGSSTRDRWWSRRSAPGWLDLRAALADREVEGLLRVTPRVIGAFAVPWQGLAGALAAHSCGTVPRTPST